MGKSVGVAEFKANCTRLLREMRKDRMPITVTSRGKPVAVMMPPPVENEPGIDKAFGCLRGVVTKIGDWDETGPVDPDWEVEWEAKWDRLGFPVLNGPTDR